MSVMRKNEMYTKVSLAAVVALLFAMLIFNPSISAAESVEGHNLSNEIGLFLGGTHHCDNDGFTIGIDYEHRINEVFGVGGLIEYVDGQFDAWVVGAPLYVHPYMGLRFLVAPGFVSEENDTKFLFRAGIGYQIELVKNWSITPAYNIDFVEGVEPAHVYGLSIGYGF